VCFLSPEYHAEVAEEFERHRGDEKNKSRGNRMQESGLSAEALLKQQQELFKMARADPLATTKQFEEPPK